MTGRTDVIGDRAGRAWRTAAGHFDFAAERPILRYDASKATVLQPSALEDHAGVKAMRFQELLEAPQAIPGDLDWDDVELRYTETGFTKFWKVVGHLDTPLGRLDIASGQDSWIVGKMHVRDDDPDKKEFRAVVRADGEKPMRTVPYSNPVVIRFVYVVQNERVTGLTTAFYRWLVQSGRNY